METVDTVVCDDQSSLLESTESTSGRGRRSTLWVFALALSAMGFGGAATLKARVPSSTNSNEAWMGLWWVGKAERDVGAVQAIHAAKATYGGYDGTDRFWKLGRTPGSADTATPKEGSKGADTATPKEGSKVDDCSSFNQQFEKNQCLQKRCKDVTDQVGMSNCLLSQCAATDSICRAGVCDTHLLLSKTKCRQGKRDCAPFDDGEEKWKCFKFECDDKTDQIERSNCLVDKCIGKPSGCLAEVCSVLSDPGQCKLGQRDCSKYDVGETEDRQKCVHNACADQPSDSDELVNCFIDHCAGDKDCLNGAEHNVCDSSHLPTPSARYTACTNGVRFWSKYASAKRHAIMAKQCVQTNQKQRSNCLIGLCLGVDADDTTCLTEVCAGAGLTDSDACFAGTMQCAAYGSSESTEKNQCLQNTCLRKKDNTHNLANCLLAQCADDDRPWATCATAVCTFLPPADPSRLPQTVAGGAANPVFDKCTEPRFQCGGVTPVEDRHQCFVDACHSDKVRGPAFFANCIAESCADELDPVARAACRVELCLKADTNYQAQCRAGRMNLDVYDVATSAPDLHKAIRQDCSVYQDLATLSSDKRMKAQSNCILDSCSSKAAATAPACRTLACDHVALTAAIKVNCQAGEEYCEARGDSEAKFSCLTQKCGGNFATGPYNTEAKVNNCVVEWCNTYSNVECRKQVCKDVKEMKDPQGVASLLITPATIQKCIDGQKV